MPQKDCTRALTGQYCDLSDSSEWYKGSTSGGLLFSRWGRKRCHLPTPFIFCPTHIMQPFKDQFSAKTKGNIPTPQQQPSGHCFYIMHVMNHAAQATGGQNSRATAGKVFLGGGDVRSSILAYTLLTTQSLCPTCPPILMLLAGSLGLLS